ncbi:MAG: hypothetical protein QM640_04600 [Niabella sp.]
MNATNHDYILADICYAVEVCDARLTGRAGKTDDSNNLSAR